MVKISDQGDVPDYKSHTEAGFWYSLQIGYDTCFVLGKDNKALSLKKKKLRAGTIYVTFCMNFVITICCVTQFKETECALKQVSMRIKHFGRRC